MNIAVIHFVIGKTDGVSLEIEKRAAILTKLGHKIIYICGHTPKQYNKSGVKIYRSDALNLDNPKNIFMLETMVKTKQQSLPSTVLINWYESEKTKAYNKLLKIFKKCKIDRIVIHNVLSLPLIPPTSSALVDLLDHFQLPTLCINHDFYFERWGFLESPYPYVRDKVLLLPPKRDYIHHQVINSLSEKVLKNSKKIKAEVIGDVFDFDKPAFKKDKFNSDFLDTFGIKKDDIVVLQATRITQRKAIENSVTLCHHLEKILRKKAPITVNEKNFTKNSKVVLFFSNYTKPSDEATHNYLLSLYKLAQGLNVTIINRLSKIRLNRCKNGKQKTYSFWDAYVFTDIVAYPSIQEGFGNQLLEAIYYKKPMVLFEYPVFKADLKSLGYKYISLGDKSVSKNGFNLVKNERIAKASQWAVKILTNPALYNKIVESNLRIAKKHHDIRSIEKSLNQWLGTD